MYDTGATMLLGYMCEADAHAALGHVCYSLHVVPANARGLSRNITALMQVQHTLTADPTSPSLCVRKLPVLGLLSYEGGHMEVKLKPDAAEIQHARDVRNLLRLLLLQVQIHQFLTQILMQLCQEEGKPGSSMRRGVPLYFAEGLMMHRGQDQACI